MNRPQNALPLRCTRILLQAALLLVCARAVALDADIELAQLDHRAWVSADVAPTQIRSITQAPDGTLWLASSSALTTFDSVKFRAINQPNLTSSNLTAVMTTTDGTLWFGDMWGGVTEQRRPISNTITNLRQKDFQGIRFGERDGLPVAPVRAILRDTKGVIWLVSGAGLFRFEGSRWRRLGQEQGIRVGPALGAFVSRNGDLWLATNDGVFTSSDGGAHFLRASSESVTPDVATYFAQAPDGAIWLSDSGRGLMRLEPGSASQARWLLPGQALGPLLFDRDGSLWIGGDRLRRMTRAQQARGEADELTHAGGLSGDRVLSLFEDRDGIIWAGTELGLDRFRHADVVWVVTPRVGRNKVIVPGRGNRVWVADEDGSLFAFDGAKLAKRMPAPVFTAGMRDRDDMIWFAGPQGIARLIGERIELIALPPAARGFDVQAMAKDGAGTLWVSIADKGLYRLAERQWSAVTNPALPDAAPLTATSDEQGDVWFGYPNDRLARVSGNDVRLFAAKDGLNVGSVTALHARGSRLWVGGELALALFDAGRFTTVNPLSCQPFTAITGLFETASNELWIFRRGALSRVERLDQELRADPEHRVLCESIGTHDSRLPTPQQLRPTPSLTVAGDNRVWLAANEGLAWIDVARFRPHVTVPPHARIEWLSTDQVTPRTQDFITQTKYVLPVNTSYVQITFTAANLGTPESVRFKYRLLGAETGWTDTLRNDVSYVNLSPGSYRFEVVTKDRDSDLQSQPSAVEFVILPAFYQTIWFRALCALVGLVLLAFFVRMQVRTANARLRARLEDRMRERERIARELHDTLLQGIQALVLRFQGVAARIPANEPARDLMERALELADDVISEGRERVHDLRDAGNAELPEEIARAGNEIFQGTAIQFGVAVHGTVRALHPIVREESFFIAREALANAHRHAKPGAVEVQLFYDRSELRLTVRDDGCGMDEDILRAGGREKHWGLLGMRERTTRMRGHLEIWSRSGLGTEIELRVPASVAYQSAERGWRWPWQG